MYVFHIVGYFFKMDFQWYEFKKVNMFLLAIQLDASSFLPQSSEKCSNQVWFLLLVETLRSTVVQGCYSYTKV